MAPAAAASPRRGAAACGLWGTRGPDGRQEDAETGVLRDRYEQLEVLMENVELKTIQRGADRYSAALSRTSEYRSKEKGIVIKSLKQDDTIFCQHRFI